MRATLRAHGEVSASDWSNPLKPLNSSATVFDVCSGAKAKSTVGIIFLWLKIDFVN